MPGQPTGTNFIDLDVSSVTIEEPTGGISPLTIVDPAKPFDVWASVALTGGGINLLSTHGWRIEYFAERMGPGADLSLGVKTGTLGTVTSPSANLAKADTKITVTVGSATPGVYRLGCVFTMPADKSIVGFAEGGLFQVA